jgi:hypothetical protein
VTGQADVVAGPLALVADHLVLALRDGSSEDPAFFVSWYAVTFAAGAPGGNLAFIRSPVLPTGELVVTDSPELDRALRQRLRPKAWPLRDPDGPALPATFERAPLRDGRLDARIVAEAHTVEVSWSELGAPIVATGRVGADPPWDTSTVLIEAAGFSAMVDGRPSAGRPFPNPVWEPWFGRPLSSALIAFAEVFREAAT